MRFILSFAIGILMLAQQANGQEGDLFAIDSLKQYERQLRRLGDSLLDSESQFTRQKSAKEIIVVFREALGITGAYEYPFDSLTFMSRLRSPDDEFRLFSWVLKLDGARYRYFGVIHMKDENRVLYHPLFDRSVDVEPGLIDKVDPTSLIVDSTYSNQQWFGMYYYDIGLLKKRSWFGLKTEKYYVLCGWDGNNDVSHKKIIDVLHFDDGIPIFGAPIVNINGEIQTRFVLEYNSQAVITLKYHPKHDMLSFDDLVPPNKKSEGFYFTYIPSGAYNYLEWEKGQLVLKEDLFNNFRKEIKEAQ